MNLVNVIGGAAAVCTTVAFVPQILKIRRQGGADLSYPMLLLYLTGIVLWLVYGLMLHAAAIICQCCHDGSGRHGHLAQSDSPPRMIGC